MDELLSQTGLEEYLKHHGLPLLERFGQNFLIDHNVLDEIVSAANPDPKVPIIEIGAGLGVLTLAIADAMAKGTGDSEHGTGRIFAIELDRRIAPLLKHRTKKIPSIKVIEGDILNLYPELIFFTQSESDKPVPSTLTPVPFDVIGNIPYNITSKLIRHILGWKLRPRSITFLMDSAVAERITAKPDKMSVLAISVHVFAEPKIVGPVVLPTAFVPQPKVKSSILRMETRKEPLVPEELQKEFFSLVKGGFAQKRKTLQNSLHALWHCSGEEAAKILKKADIEPSRRAQTLSIEEWLQILAVKNN
ncbi:MAG: 16S rRNA (adenine(1518)-N(6)/adenine(1519)-N(6))-dimethyltransferase RsmA [bacterium]|nr:16S rRNA (adenine(1518)-N(6)/adenine(1519)-N(6))-dimethyltransferase RsmA [bacterium]